MGNDLQTVLLLYSAFPCIFRFFGLTSSDTVTTLVQSLLASFLPSLSVVPAFLIVTLRTNSRKQEPQTIPNTNNWLFRLIRKELADYFPDIQTAEEARQELERRKPSAGAKPMNTRYPIVAYGIYRMLHEENAMSENPDTPNELCRLIYDYTRFVGCYPSYKGYDGSFNPKNIRADIGYIKKNVQKYGGEKIPKFPSVEFGRIHIVTDNIVHKDLF